MRKGHRAPRELRVAVTIRRLEGLLSPHPGLGAPALRQHQAQPLRPEPVVRLPTPSLNRLPDSDAQNRGHILYESHINISQEEMLVLKVRGWRDTAACGKVCLGRTTGRHEAGAGQERPGGPGRPPRALLPGSPSLPPRGAGNWSATFNHRLHISD